MLGIRTAFKPDLECSADELVYGTTLRIPVDFFRYSKSSGDLDPSDYVQRFRQAMTHLRATPPRPSTNCVRQPLQQLYDGPFRVLSRKDKHFTIGRGGRTDVVSIDHLMAAYNEPLSTSPTEQPPLGTLPLAISQTPFTPKTARLPLSHRLLPLRATILLGYDFDIRYCRTTDFGQAGTLTGLISNKQEPEKDTAIAAISIEDDSRRQLSDAIRGIPVTSADIRRATEQDPVLHRSITLMFADRVLIPSSLRPTVLRQFHAAHPGASRMKSIARSFAYWPGIDGDIDDLVRRCYRC
nr:unnamed protein product [Spirometra erinaceieuropaei]